MQFEDSSSKLIEPYILSFYGWWQLLVCLVAFVALISIWWHIGKKQGDFGQVWLALSVLCWSFSGAIEVYYTQDFLSTQEIPTAYLESDLLNGFRSIFSLINSLFILMALPWFRYIPKQIRPLIKSKYWYLIIGLPFVFSFLPTVSKMISGINYGIISELDVYFSTLTLAFLGIVLWESFACRRLPTLAWLSVACIILTFVAQIYKLTGSNVGTMLFSAIFKTSLIMIFFALALSWVKELSENIIPSAHVIHIKFIKVKNPQGRLDEQVQLNGIPGKSNLVFKLTPALHDLLKKFAQRKCDGNQWLEIKPKNDQRSGKSYDIQDHNQIKRLIHAMLDNIFGVGSWTKKQHATPLRLALFELSDKRERKIKLTIPTDNISFDTNED